MSASGIFHEGERAVQARAGEALIADHNGGVLAASVIPGARAFIAKQFMVALASVDAQGRVWSSLVFGKPGFLDSGAGERVRMAAPLARRDRDDPFWANVAHDPRVGMLFIEIGSRRRYRVNGRMAGMSDDGIDIAIDEAYPNCPKFIQRRKLTDMGERGGAAPAAMRGSAIAGEVAHLVRQADTLFVASVHPQRGADVSHRGGAAGFVSLLGDGTLRIPDYQGNSMFNTLGNFAIDPHAGICIPDFAGNRLLQLTGSARLRWDLPDPDARTGGTGRFWDFTPHSWILRATPQQLAWEYLDASPFNPAAAGGQP